MKITLRHHYLSEPRYSRYLIAVNGDVFKARKLYHANIRLAQAFHPIISQFEVILRNCINKRLGSHFNDHNWIINQKNGFMSHESLKESKFFILNQVQKTEYRFRKKGIPITNGKIVSEQNFGFWLAFFLPHHHKLLEGQLIHIFSNKPNSANRATIYGKLDRIREFRNRVNHCEPLCFHGNRIDCMEAIEVLEDIYDLLSWIGNDIIPFIKKFDGIEGKINQINNI